MKTRQKSGQVTINVVAREAGVSTQTVSRVINNRPDVSPETRDRVLDVVARLNYQPNAIARSLISQRTRTLGVVATGLEYFGPSRTLIGIEQQSNAMGYSLLLSLLHQPEIEDVEQLLSGLLAKQVDGIIWAVPEIGNNRFWLRQRIARLSAPIIFLSMHTEPSIPVVAIDNRSGGRLATEHLIAQGYRRVGLITGPMNWWEARERRVGWEDAMQGAGISWNDSWVAEGDWSAESGERGLRQLLDRCPDLDAVFSSNDQMALGLLKATQKLGRKVPHELGVVGFDNIPEAAYFWPALTSVRQRLREMGAMAVQTLVHMIEAGSEDGASSPAILLQPELVVRESSLINK